MASKKRFDVFLSHNSRDKAWVIRLKNVLEKRGIKVWLDKDEIRPGDLFAMALEKGIAESKAVALVVSPESMNSGWVRAEYYRALSLATNHELQLIPVLYKNADIPGFLSDRSWVDFRSEEEYDSNVDNLVWGITGKRLRSSIDPEPRDDSTSKSTPEVPLAIDGVLSVLGRKYSVDDVFSAPVEVQIALYKKTLENLEEYLDMQDLTRITQSSFGLVKSDLLSIIEGFRRINSTRNAEVYRFVNSIDRILARLRTAKLILFEAESLFDGDRLPERNRRVFYEKMEECRTHIADALRGFM